VAWVDSLARGKNLGRGIFFCGNHSEKGDEKSEHSKRRTIGVPFNAPSFVLNPMTMRSFNALYYRMHRRAEGKMVHYEPFFYPLDSVRNWNRLYGKRGFFQYQCVVPSDDGVDTINELLERATHANQGSFLSVLKTFGDRRSEGLLSFPRQGMTLALDLPNKGRKTLDLMNHLDSVVGQAGGAVYPAKDARMSAESFQRYFPNWRDFAGFVDPKFSSSFWRRVTGEAPA
jgi:hypothetical protein